MMKLFKFAFLCVGLALLAGCAMAISISGIDHIDQIPGGMSRAEVGQRFGAPLAVNTTATGRNEEVFHIRRRMTRRPLGNVTGVEAMGGLMLVCLNPIFLGMCMQGEINAIETAIKSERNKLHVGFVYGPDDRALYYYELKADAAVRFEQAANNLVNPLLNAMESIRCVSTAECMQQFVEESRRRADEVGYSLDSEAERIFAVQLQLARDIDDRKITREDAVAQLARANLAGLSVVSCVADYVAAVRRRATELGYLPNAQDEEFIAEELRIARDADAGEISRELAHSRLLSESTRHLIKLYQNQDTVGPASRQLYDAARPLTDVLLKKIDENRCRQ